MNGTSTYRENASRVTTGDVVTYKGRRVTIIDHAPSNRPGVVTFWGQGPRGGVLPVVFTDGAAVEVHNRPGN